jgi:hypothetical protein
MKRRTVVALIGSLVMTSLSACAPNRWQTEPGLPGELARQDPGTLSGIWRQSGRDGIVLSVMDFGQYYTFAVRRGCAISGGVLRPAGGDRYAIERYTSGLSDDKCGPWRNGPELVPFDGEAVFLKRAGQTLEAGSLDGRIVLHRQAN